MTALDELRAAIKAWDDAPRGAGYTGASYHAGQNVCRAAERLLAELEAHPASGAEALRRLFEWLLDGLRHVGDTSSREVMFNRLQALKPELASKIDRLLAALAAPQPSAPQPKAPEPSADARAWRERIETAIAATNEKRTSPLLSCPELTVHGLLDEAMDHWTDATCSGCAAADERARRAEAERDVALAESRGLAHDVIDRARERDEARKERDLARQQAHDAGERADNVKMQLDDTIGRLAPTRERVYLNATIRTLARLLTEAKR